MLHSSSSVSPAFLGVRVNVPFTVRQCALSPPQTPHLSSTLWEPISLSQPTFWKWINRWTRTIFKMKIRQIIGLRSSQHVGGRAPEKKKKQEMTGTPLVTCCNTAVFRCCKRFDDIFHCTHSHTHTHTYCTPTHPPTHTIHTHTHYYY